MLCSSVSDRRRVALACSDIFQSKPASYIADLLGRRVGVVIGNVVILVGTVIQVVPSVNRGMFIAGRFLVGFGCASTIADLYLSLLTGTARISRRDPPPYSLLSSPILSTEER